MSGNCRKFSEMSTPHFDTKYRPSWDRIPRCAQTRWIPRLRAEASLRGNDGRGQRLQVAREIVPRWGRVQESVIPAEAGIQWGGAFGSLPQRNDACVRDFVGVLRM